jgi:serine/threonine-protein kinase RsbW
MKRTGRLTLDATLEQVSAALELFMEQLQRHGTQEDRDAIQLGAAEVLSNIVRHGYRGGEGVIRVSWRADRAALVIHVCDCGRPIPDSTFRDSVNTVFDFEHTDVTDLPEGGLGLGIVRQVFDDVRYRTRLGVNRLVAVREFG